MLQDNHRQSVAAFEVDAVGGNHHILPEVAGVVLGQKKAQELATSIVVVKAAAAGTLEMPGPQPVHHMCRDLLLAAGPGIVADVASAVVVLTLDKRQVVVLGCQKQEPAVPRGKPR